MNNLKKTGDWRRPLVVALAVGLVCAVIMLAGLLESWSHRATDRLYLSHAADSRIVIVNIDDASIARLGRWPWARSVHADLINKISSGKPLAIGYDVNFPEVSNVKDDTALADAIRAAGNVVLPVELAVPKRAGETLAGNKYLASISQIVSAAAGIGHVNTPQDADGVVRRLPLRVNLPDGSSVEAFSLKLSETGGVGVYPLPVGADRNMLVNYPDGPGTSFKSETFSAADVIDGRVPAQAFAGKFVFVGATAPDLHDDEHVPTSLSANMPGVEIHASILDTLLQKKFLYDLPGWVLSLILLVLSALVGLLLPRLRLRWSVPGAIVLWIVVLAMALWLFDRGWIMDVLWPTLVIFLSFTAVTLERRLTSERQKREIRSAFSRYVSGSVVDSILADTSKLKLGGDRRRMTVLFSDVRGFTTISEGLKPERLVELMNIYLSRMTNIVFDYNGVLDKYIGDAVMAFWNAPFDQKDHAQRAVDTALDMLAALKVMNQEKKFGDVVFKIGVGVNTGDMVVGNMGSERRFDYTVIGDSVNLGSRMESLTKEYGVCLLISQATKDELGEGYLIRTIDLVAVKGKKEPVRMFEVMCHLSDATEEQKQIAADYETAFQAYEARDFNRAIELTGKILAAHPDDGPSKTLTERAQHFQQEPPPADWNGAWVMTKK